MFNQDELFIIKQAVEAAAIKGADSHVISDLLKKIESEIKPAQTKGTDP